MHHLQRQRGKTENGVIRQRVDLAKTLKQSDKSENHLSKQSQTLYPVVHPDR